MTIKEIECLLGMTRANIRYYEQEALLHPQRQKNGYRDYSEQDLLSLKKIKLLRELGVPLADIKKLQNGDLLLSEEMQHQIKELEQQQIKTGYAKAICTDIYQEQVSYQQLNADRYLSGAFWTKPWNISAEGEHHAEYLIQDRPQKISPVRRFLARAFDMLLILEASICIVSLFHENYYFFLPLLSTIAVLQIISILVEPILLHFTGTTVGKWIFGFYLTDIDGRHLSYRAAFWRTVKVYFLGMGFGIPFLNLYRLYKSYVSVKEGWKAPWDDEVEYLQKTSVRVRWLSRFSNESWRYALLLSVFLVSFAFTNRCIRYALVPVNCGNITMAEFVENYNQIARYFGYTEYFYHLKPDGTFYTAQESYQKRAEKQNSTGTVLIDAFGDYALSDFSYSFDGKYLKQAEMHIDLNNYSQTEYFIYPLRQMTFAVLAFAGAQEDIGNWRNERGKVAEKMLRTEFGECFSFEMGGMKIACDVKSTGFSPVNDYLMAWNDKNRFHLEFMISRKGEKSNT